MSAMRQVRAPRVNTHGWAIRLRFGDLTLAERSLDRDVVVGEAPGCDLVLPGLGARVRLTAGASLLAAPGLQVLGDPPTGPLDPDASVALRVAAHPEVSLVLTRVRLERLPFSTRVPLRDLARQLVLGAGLVGALALLWRVETVENVLRLKGDPEALADSELFRVMFYSPAPEPIEVVRARELFFVPPPPPPPAAPPPPAPPAGDDFVDAGPAVALLADKDPEVAPMPEGERLLAGRVAPDEGETRRARRPRRGETAVLAELKSLEVPALDVLEGGVVSGVPGGVVEAVEEVRGFEGGFEGGGPDGGPGGVPGGVVGGVVGAPADAQVGILGVLHTDPTPADPPGPSAQPGPHSHDAAGAEATRGELGGTAAVVAASSCPDPSVSRKQQLDVVFVVDVSTTMTFMLSKIQREIADVDRAARAQGLDARYGLVVFVDDVKVAGEGRAYADLAALQADLRRWQDFTASNRQIGSPATNLDWPENTLDALYAAAEQFSWRPAETTLRAIVHATDDDFGEAPAVQSGQVVQHTYRQTLAALQSAEVRVFSFAAKIGGQCECLDVKAGIFAPYAGQKAIPAATGGAVFDIDEVAAGALSFGTALSGALQTSVCTHYPLRPF